jgi:hypothetical protein
MIDVLYIVLTIAATAATAAAAAFFDHLGG